MKTYLRVVEYLYLAIAIFLAEETIRTWGEDPSRSYLYAALALMALFMFFFRGWSRKKIDRKNQE